MKELKKCHYPLKACGLVASFSWSSLGCRKFHAPRRGKNTKNGNFWPRIPILWGMTGLVLDTHVDIDVYHSDGWVVHMKAYTNTRPANMISTIHDQWDFLSFTHRRLHVSCGFPLVNIGEFDFQIYVFQLSRSKDGCPSSASWVRWASPCERINFGMPKSICDPVLICFYVVHFKICLIPGHPFLTHNNIINTYRHVILVTQNASCHSVSFKPGLKTQSFERCCSHSVSRLAFPVIVICPTPGSTCRHCLARATARARSARSWQNGLYPRYQ